MRTSVFLAFFGSLGLFCVTRAADTPLENFNSSVHLVETRHFHLGNGKVKDSHDNETYVTEDPHMHHHGKHSTAEAKHETPKFQNTEPDIIEFFRAANEGTAYEETDKKKQHMHDDPDKAKLPKSSYMDHPMEKIEPGHGMEDHRNRAGHVMVTDHDMVDHGTHDDHHHHMKMKMNDTGSMMHDMMMMMYFHTGVKETVLFKQWKITTVGGLIGSMVGIFLLAMLYEGLKYFREHLFKKYVSSIQFSTVAVTGESGRVTQVHKLERHQMMSWSHAVQTALHVVQIILSYFLMLIFMTYNVWLCLSLVLGAGVGYFIFGWKKATVVDITEHCH